MAVAKPLLACPLLSGFPHQRWGTLGHLPGWPGTTHTQRLFPPRPSRSASDPQGARHSLLRRIYPDPSESGTADLPYARHTKSTLHSSLNVFSIPLDAQSSSARHLPSQWLCQATSVPPLRSRWFLSTVPRFTTPGGSLSPHCPHVCFDLEAHCTAKNLMPMSVPLACLKLDMRQKERVPWLHPVRLVKIAVDPE
jgi:hypothetical protein